jgi:hypothetical protein
VPIPVGPEPPHPCQVVLELRELDLQLSFGAVRVVGEDVQDHRGAIDHRDPERLLEVSLLSRDELVVARDQIGVGAADLRLDLGELSAADVPVRIGPTPHLDHLPRRRDAGGAQELLQLGEGIAVASRRG